MGIANYTNLSELMNKKLNDGAVISLADLAEEAEIRGLILASEGTLADRADLENAFIALAEKLYRDGAIKPLAENEAESQLIRLFESGELADSGYGGKEGDQFIKIKWTALTDDLPVIVNINL
jgi:hypothetical protein